MRSSSIRTQLLLLVLTTSVPLCCLLAAGLYMDMQSSVAHTKSALRMLAKSMVSNTGSTLAAARGSLERLAERPLVKLVDRERCDPALKDFLTMNPAYANVAYVGLDGQVACSAVPMAGGRNSDVRSTPWFKVFAVEKRALVGMPHKGLITGKWVSVVAAPIYDEAHEVVGAIYLPLDLSVLDPHIPDSELPADSRYGFLASNGTLIWRNRDPENVIGTKPDAQAARRMLEVRDGEFESIGVDGMARYFSVQVMPDSGWVAYVGVPVTTVYAAAKQRALMSALAALGALIALTLLAVTMARRIIHPIAQLEHAALQVHAGDFSARVSGEGPREIVRVAQAFNAMAAQIESSTRRLAAEVEERRAVEAQVRDMAFRDALTQLPNRRLLHDRLTQAMAASKRSACYCALLFLDLDRFKPLNDQHGHAAGDLLLMEAAARLQACVRAVDTVARIGGDEFVVMISELDPDRAISQVKAAAIAEKIRQALAQPYRLLLQRELLPDTELEHRCSVSIGVALFRAHELAEEDILKAADVAMYQAKALGGDQACFHEAAD